MLAPVALVADVWIRSQCISCLIIISSTSHLTADPCHLCNQGTHRTARPPAVPLIHCKWVRRGST